MRATGLLRRDDVIGDGRDDEGCSFIRRGMIQIDLGLDRAAILSADPGGSRACSGSISPIPGVRSRAPWRAPAF